MQVFPRERFLDPPPPPPSLLSIPYICIFNHVQAAAPAPLPLLAAALGSLAYPSRSARPRNCLNLT